MKVEADNELLNFQETRRDSIRLEKSSVLCKEVDASKMFIGICGGDSRVATVKVHKLTFERNMCGKIVYCTVFAERARLQEAEAGENRSYSRCGKVGGRNDSSIRPKP